jgi:hypothetical protein
VALISFLALEWHDSILEYLQQGGGETSNTPSYQQVSQPLHTRLIAQASGMRFDPGFLPCIDRLRSPPKVYVHELSAIL